MAEAYGIFSLWGQGHHDQIYIGWNKEMTVGEGFTDIFWGSNEGIRVFWETMGNNGASIWDALSATSQLSLQERKAVWGDNGLMDIGEPDSDDNIQIYGEGLNNELCSGCN